MANSINEQKKIKGKSQTEPRDQQLLSRAGGNWLSDEEFAALLDKSQLDTKNVSVEILFEKFYEKSDTTFFQSFREREKTIASFQRNFGAASASIFIEKAEKIVAGQFDLLGFENLDFGAAEIDWHLEPVSGRRSPLKRWKQFDGLSADETGDPKIIRELNRCQHFFTLGLKYETLSM